MSTTFNYSLRDAMRALSQKHRLDVLMMLVLYSNGLSRCWPSMKTLARDTDIGLATVSAAKQWLIDHGAVTLVPYNKRVGDELKLARRQHVYQLTGELTIDNKVVPYLYLQKPKVSENETSQNEVSESEISDSETFRNHDLEVFPEENTSKSTDTSKMLIAQSAALGPITIYEPDPEPNYYGDMFVAVRLHCFEDDHSKATGKRVGSAAKAIIADFPKLSISEFEEFIHWWKVTKNIDLPKGETTLPSAIGQWKNRDNARSARDDTPFKRVPKKEKGQ